MNLNKEVKYNLILVREIKAYLVELCSLQNIYFLIIWSVS